MTAARLAAALVAIALSVAGIAAAATPAAAQVGQVVPPAKAWIVVDAGSGAILDAGNARTPVPVASAIKLLTALIAVQTLPPDATVPVSERAAAMPARKLNMHAGEVWTLNDTLHSLLLSSANDAAAALAERVGGTMEDFAVDMKAAGEQLGLNDSPVLQDPSGLDDESSIGGGNVVSARDMAVVARAALADDRVASIVATREYAFTGPDGVPHHLINHNKLLATYPGAIGMKTGYTSKSGHTLVAAARRDGRAVIAVVLGATDLYGAASGLLDKGFATPARTAEDELPPIRSLVPAKEAETARATATDVAAPGNNALPATDIGEPPGSTASFLRFIATAVFRLMLGVVAVAVPLRIRAMARQAARRRRRRARALAVLHAGQRPIDIRTRRPVIVEDREPVAQGSIWR